jgi:hypothetical protein
MSEPTFSFSTTAEELATCFSGEIKGAFCSPFASTHKPQPALITGSSICGIGFEAARVIAKHAKLVVITGYNEERSSSWFPKTG